MSKIKLTEYPHGVAGGKGGSVASHHPSIPLQGWPESQITNAFYDMR